MGHRDDHLQQLLPGLDLSWLADCANELNDARYLVQDLHRQATADALDDLAAKLATARAAMMEAERAAAALARSHWRKGMILVGDTERDGVPGGP